MIPWRRFLDTWTKTDSVIEWHVCLHIGNNQGNKYYFLGRISWTEVTECDKCIINHSAEDQGSLNNTNDRWKTNLTRLNMYVNESCIKRFPLLIAIVTHHFESMKRYHSKVAAHYARYKTNPRKLKANGEENSWILFQVYVNFFFCFNMWERDTHDQDKSPIRHKTSSSFYNYLLTENSLEAHHFNLTKSPDEYFLLFNVRKIR